MSLHSAPRELLAKAVIKFLDGASPEDRARPQALANFIVDAVEGKSEEDLKIADRSLNDPSEIEKLVRLAADAISDEHHALKEKHKTDHERRVENFHADLQKSNTWGLIISAGISLCTFVVGLVLSPVMSVLFKHQLNDFDKKMHPEDFPRKKEECIAPLPTVATVAVPAEQPTSGEGFGKKPVLKQNSLDGVVYLQETPYGLKDPVTHMGMLDLLEQGKTVLLPHSKTGLFLRRPTPNVCAQPQATAVPGG